MAEEVMPRVNAAIAKSAAAAARGARVSA